jgi:tRNA (mo5U34)-methyltransferase
MPGTGVCRDDRLDMDDREAMSDPGLAQNGLYRTPLRGDPTNWWAPNHAGVEALLRSSGMQVTDRLGHEIYVCRPDPDNPACVQTWNRAELLAATGRTETPS